MPHYRFSLRSISPAIDSWIFLTPNPSESRIAHASKQTEPSQNVEYTKEEIHCDLLPYRPEATQIRQGQPFQTTCWQTWDKILTALQSNNPNYRSDPTGYTDRMQQHQSKINTFHPLIESGVLDFMTTCSAFTIDANPTPYTYYGFPKETTASYRITYGSIWVGTIHLARDTASELLTGTSTEAEFILLSETFVRSPWTF
jgi:hypothetical protein